MKGQEFFSCHTINYDAFNKLKSKDFLVIPTKFQYQTKAIRNILSQVLSQYFGKKFCKVRIIINDIRLPKYKKWPMPLKKMQCTKKKANILSLPILPYNKAGISEIIDIFKELIQHLDLDDYVFKDKIVMAKED